MTASHPDRVFLDQLLSERNQNPDRVAEIDAEVWRKFGRKVAILALDMCGFSRLASSHGIIHFLAMIHQMQRGAGPAITDNGGKLVKHEADNVFAIFADPAQALEAAVDIFRAFEAMNAVVPDERDIYGSVGIGYGETLVIAESDLYGNEVNLACKLGEDLAGKSEILLTPAAFAALPLERYNCEAVSFNLGKSEFRGYKYDKHVVPQVRV